MDIYTLPLESPIGTLTLEGTDTALTALRFGTADGGVSSPVLELAAQQLSEYFAGDRRTFTVPLSPAGTPFRQTVWQALLSIPYGGTATYGAIARQIGKPNACRAVGMANNRNPIAIIVPCHRIIGSTGALVGYGGGLGMKERLLELERRYGPAD